MNNDIKSLSNTQLLTALLGNETLSIELQKQFSYDLGEMAKNLVLTKIKGLGESKLTLLMCAFELGKRKAMLDEINRLHAQTITDSTAIFAHFNQELSDLDHEELWALYLSKSGKILKKQRISEGGTDFAGADIKKIVKPAVNLMASYVALCHNHPHSTTKPSNADREMTKHVEKALSLFDIRLLDHIIISDGKYYSFRDNGDL